MKEPRRSSNIQNENALSRKRPKRLSFEDSFLKEDKDYIPPHGSKIRSSQPKQRNKLVTRPAKRNMRDPFMVLNDDLVFLVIDQISAKDTEILRRVSKLWKACSEVHCGRNALQKHFPIAALRAGGILSREEENIRFRRYLYYQESLRIGYATRAIRCSGATDWHIYQETLTWSNESGDISIRKLRTFDDSSLVSPEVIQLNIHNSVAHLPRVKSVQLIAAGDMIVESSNRDYEPPSDRILDCGNEIMRITQQGVVQWKVRSEFCLTKPAVGEDALYFVRLLPATENPQNGREARILKVNLKDGSISFDVPVPTEWSNRVWNTHWRLTSTERFLIWMGSDAKILIFCALSGQLFDKYTTHDGSTIVMGTVDDYYWHIGANRHAYQSCLRGIGGFCDQCSARVSYDEKTFHRKSEAVLFCSDTWTELSKFGRAFCGDQPAFVFLNHIVHPTPGLDWRFLGQQEPTDPHTSVWIQCLDPIMKQNQQAPRYLEYNDTSPLTRINLPSNSKENMERRPLEVQLPWKMKTSDFFGFENDYLIYHSRADEILLLVDFWPSW